MEVADSVPEVVGWLGVLLLGISVGLTACTVACLPFIGTWVLGRAAGGGEAAKDISLFIAGRLLGYAILGGIAGAAGEWLADALRGPAGNVAIGASGLLAGWWLAGRPSPAGACSAAKDGGRAPPFLLGLSLSLTPCAPLSSLLVASALAANPLDGAGYGLVFGIGAGITPLVLVVPLLGTFGRRMRQGKAWLGRWLRLGSGGVLMAIGLRRLILAAVGV